MNVDVAFFIVTELCRIGHFGNNVHIFSSNWRLINFDFIVLYLAEKSKPNWNLTKIPALLETAKGEKKKKSAKVTLSLFLVRVMIGVFDSY